MFVYVVHNQQE